MNQVPMFHYLVKENGGLAIVHKRYDDLDAALLQCFSAARVATDIRWYVLSTQRKLVEGFLVKEVSQ